MLSFIIFLFFLIFLFIILEPAVRTGTSKQPVLNSLESEIMKSLYIDVETITISVNNPVVIERCTNLAGSSVFISNNPLIVKNQDNLLVNYEKPGDLRIDDIGNFFKIYSSVDFPTNTNTLAGQCGSLSKDIDYNLGLAKTNKYFYIIKTNNLLDQYDTNYELLKTQLKVSSSNEFGFGFIEASGVKRETPFVDVSTDIYSQESLVQYINESGDISQGTLITRVW